MYNKLFSSITESTIWGEPHTVRIVWITLLARMDRFGRVKTSIPGLAHTARVTLDECDEAVHCLLSPDRWSNTDEHEGRRIERMDGGFRVLNAIKYRELKDDEYRRAKNAEYQRRHREKVKAQKAQNTREYQLK